jgi:AraC-like DNA-binding protein
MMARRASAELGPAAPAAPGGLGTTESFAACLAKAARRRSRFACRGAASDHARLMAVRERGIDGSFGDPLAKLVVVRRGLLGLVGEHGSWSLTPGHMVFVPAGRAHLFTILPGTDVVVVHLRQDCVAWSHEGCWVAPVPPLAREMVDYALRWGARRSPQDATANAFFAAIAGVCPEWFGGNRILWTPFAKSAELRRAVAFASAHLDTASVDAAARAAHLSARTLRRRFQAELGLSWRQFIQEIRMTRAIELLSRERLSVTQTAFAVGFNSVSAFTVAFKAYAGRPPSALLESRARSRWLKAMDADQPGVSAGRGRRA